MKITLCMIVKNESSIIEDSLSSIIDIIDSAIIGDTGSDDNTQEVIERFFKEHQKNVLIKKINWNNDFSEARNQVLQEVEDGNYVISLDADQKIVFANRPIKDKYDLPEYFEKITRKSFEDYINQTNGTMYFSININLENFEDWKRDDFLEKPDYKKVQDAPYYYHNIFTKTPGLKYYLPIHEVLIREDINFCERSILNNSRFTIIHSGYSKNFKKQKQFNSSNERNVEVFKKLFKDSELILNEFRNNLFFYEPLMIKIFENKMLYAFSLIEDKVDIKNAEKILLELVEQYEHLDIKITDKGLQNRFDRCYLKIVAEILKRKILPSEQLISLCDNVIKKFSKRKKEYLSFFHAQKSYLMLENKTFNENEIFNEILLSLIPNNEKKFMEEPVNFISNWLNNREGNERLIPILSYEPEYYLPSEGYYYKFITLLNLAKFFYLKNDLEKSIFIMSSIKKCYIFFLEDLEKNIYYRFENISYEEQSEWLNDYLNLLKKITEKLSLNSLFESEKKWWIEIDNKVIKPTNLSDL